MSAPAASLASVSAIELPCARCGYDLRAQPRDGVCPECETPVEKAIELAAVPVRPAWRESDPRWRRRMLAGAWVMVLIPLVALARWTGLTKSVPVVLYDFQGDEVGTLDESFFYFVFPYVPFCIGVVLFFSKERFWRPHPLDWTRRWGVIVSYLVLLLGVPVHGVITALVLVGIAALFFSLPLAHQPGVTDFVEKLGAGYLLYAPHDSEVVYAAAATFSACAVLLACVPIYHALRCSGPKRLALVMFATLAVISLSQIWSAVRWYLYPAMTGYEPPAFFFDEYRLASLARSGSGIAGIPFLIGLVREAGKWLVFLTIAIWLSVAQVRTWRKSPTPKPHAP